MEVITYKCPNCGGDLTFDPASGKYKCEYCLSSFTQEEAERANPKAAEALNGEDDAAGAQEASDAQKESSTEETKGETEQGEAVVYTCPNCGALPPFDGARRALAFFAPTARPTLIALRGDISPPSSPAVS